MQHDEIWHMLPWFVNGTLRPETRSSVDEHLAICGNCRSEVELQRRVRNAIAHEDSRQSSAQDSFDQLWTRISGHSGATKANPTESIVHRARSSRQGTVLRWLAAAVVLEGVGLLTLVMTGAPTGAPVGHVPPPALYRTLSTPSKGPGPGAIRAVFSTDLTLGALQSLLAHSHLRIIDGPTEAGVYTLSMEDSRQSVESTLTDLRSRPSVRFAEPIKLAPQAKQ